MPITIGTATFDDTLSISFASVTGFLTTRLTGPCVVTRVGGTSNAATWAGSINDVDFSFTVSYSGGSYSYILNSLRLTMLPAACTGTGPTSLSVTPGAITVSSNPFSPTPGSANFTPTVAAGGNNVQQNTGSGGVFTLNLYVHDGTQILTDNASAAAGDTNNPIQDAVVAVCVEPLAPTAFVFPWSQVNLGPIVSPGSPPNLRYSGVTDSNGLVAVSAAAAIRFRVLASKDGYAPVVVSVDCTGQAAGGTQTVRLYLDKLPPVDGTADDSRGRVRACGSIMIAADGSVQAGQIPALPAPGLVFASSDNAASSVVSGPFLCTWGGRNAANAWVGQDRYVWYVSPATQQRTNPQLASQLLANNGDQLVRVNMSDAGSGSVGTSSVKVRACRASYRLGTAGVGDDPIPSDFAVWLTSDAKGRTLSYAPLVVTTNYPSTPTVASAVADGTYHVWAADRRHHPVHTTVTVSADNPTADLLFAPNGVRGSYPDALLGTETRQFSLEQIFGRTLPPATVCWFYQQTYGSVSVGPVNGRTSAALVHLPFKPISSVLFSSQYDLPSQVVFAAAFHPSVGLIAVARYFRDWSPVAPDVIEDLVSPGGGTEPPQPPFPLRPFGP